MSRFFLCCTRRPICQAFPVWCYISICKSTDRYYIVCICWTFCVVFSSLYFCPPSIVSKGNARSNYFSPFFSSACMLQIDRQARQIEYKCEKARLIFGQSLVQVSLPIVKIQNSTFVLSKVSAWSCVVWPVCFCQCARATWVPHEIVNTLCVDFHRLCCRVQDTAVVICWL